MTAKRTAISLDRAYVRVSQTERTVWRVALFDGSPYAVGVWFRRSEAAATRKGNRELGYHNHRFGSLSAGFTIQ